MLHQQIMARAMNDEAFRQELLANPKAVLERELGITLPRGASVQVHEDTAAILHLVLPKKLVVSEPVDLSDAQHEQVSTSHHGCDVCGWYFFEDNPNVHWNGTG
jgi:hypothetical protein